MTSYLIEIDIYIFFNNKYFILLKIVGLYCAVVCKRGGNACIDIGVGSDGCRSVLNKKKGDWYPIERER